MKNKLTYSEQDINDAYAILDAIQRYSIQNHMRLLRTQSEEAMDLLLQDIEKKPRVPL